MGAWCRGGGCWSSGECPASVVWGGSAGKGVTSAVGGLVVVVTTVGVELGRILPAVKISSSVNWVACNLSWVS